MRTNLLVPFAEKDHVRSLGARWDMARKVWYVPDGIDLYSFLKWLPKHLTGELKSPVKKALKKGRA